MVYLFIQCFLLINTLLHLHHIGTGITLYAIGSSLVHKYRLKKYLRSYYRTMLEKLSRVGYNARLAGLLYYTNNHRPESENRLSDESKSKHTEQTPSLQVREFAKVMTVQMGMACREASKRIISSPSTSLSSTLHVSVLSLPPNSQMQMQETQGLEVYLVMDGSGLLSVDGESVRIFRSCTFSIDPYKRRHLVNKGKQDLVFVRISDGGTKYDDTNFDLVTPLPKSKRRRTIDMFLEGFNTISNCASG